MTDHSDQVELIRAVLANLAKIVSLQNYTVDNVITGGAPDGSDQPVLAIGSGFLPVPWLETYTAANPPAEGDSVLVLTISRSPILLGRVHGLITPDTSAPTRTP